MNKFKYYIFRWLVIIVLWWIGSKPTVCVGFSYRLIFVINKLHFQNVRFQDEFHLVAKSLQMKKGDLLNLRMFLINTHLPATPNGVE